MDAQKAECRAVSFIRNYFSQAKRKTAVVGLSGGLDSAVAAALCCRALGSKNTVCVFLPSKATPAQDMEDAQALARKLGTRTASFPIEPVIRAYRWVSWQKLDRANCSARIRMTVLYSIARNENGLVIGTGDKSEFLLGYFTKHGDGGADLFPIGNLYKTEVKKLAVHLGIPQSIVNKPPSPALWAGQTAEKEMGFSYLTADGILMGIEKRTPKAALESKFGKKEVAAVLKRMKENSHKLKPAPVCKL